MATQEVLITPASGKIEFKDISGGTILSTIKDIDGVLYLIPSSSSVVITGNLTVNGTNTTLNSTTLTVDDIHIEIGSVDTPTDITANGGGIILKGSTDKSILWDNANDNWTLNQHVNIPSSYVYKINNVSILSADTLGSSVINSSLTSVGTITTGTWSATTIAVNKGGTGITSYAIGDLLYASGTTTLAKLADVATGSALISGGVGVAPSWGKIGLTTHISGTLAVGNGGTGTATQFTTGSIVFTGASGVYSQNNGNLFWDNSNNRLGIGTASPSTRLEVMNSASATLLKLSTTAVDSEASISLANDARTYVLLVRGSEGDKLAIRDSTAGVDRITVDNSGNVGIGVTTPLEKNHIAGNIRIDDASGNAGFKLAYNNTSKTLDFIWVGA